MKNYAIIGFVLGSIPALFFNYEIYSYYQLWAAGGYGYMPLYIEIPIGVVLLGLTIWGSYELSKLQEKKAQEVEEKPAE